MKNDQAVKKEIQAAIAACTTGVEARASLHSRIMRKAKGEERMKKRLGWVPVLATVMVLMISTVAVAEMLGVDIFAFFGKNDARYQALAPQAVLKEVSVIEVDSPELGKTKAGIHSAYYDGESLIVAYAIENGTRMEAFTPDAAMLAKMTALPQGETPAWATQNEEEAQLMAAWLSAVEKGEPMGIARYTVDAGDHTLTDDGIDLAPRVEAEKKGEDGVLYKIREYESPLAEASGRERLDISLELYQSVGYLYFDGKTCYSLYENEKIAPMRATVWQADADIRSFVGAGTFEGLELTARVVVSAASARLQIDFDGVLPAYPEEEDSWYSFELADENGKKLRAHGGCDGGTDTVTLTFDGTGAAPESLTLYIYAEEEGKRVDVKSLQPVLELNRE